ncbi:hypothetical protein [Streptosporangium sp. KLBMP 9127]|nr:hypothetical protein [Streptosporangium sp. KLBMP 9127]
MPRRSERWRECVSTQRHLPEHTNAADAVLAAAHELGVEPAAALKLAALAG